MSSLPSLGPRGEGWVVAQSVLLALTASAGLVGAPVPDTLRVALWAAGLVLLGAGGLLSVLGVLQLGSALTPFPRPRDGGRMTEAGVYRLVRHPIYGGLVIGSVGWALITASPAALALALVLLAFFRLKSAREEAWLEDRYPAYARYRARTRRLLPFLY